MTGFKFIHNYHRNHQMDDTGGRFCIAYALSDDHRVCCFSWTVCHPDDAYNKRTARKLAKENFKPGNSKYYEFNTWQLYNMVQTLNEHRFNPTVHLTLPDRFLLHNAWFLTHLKFNSEAETLNNFVFTMIKKQSFNKILTALVYMQDPILGKKFGSGCVTHGCCYKD